MPREPISDKWVDSPPPEHAAYWALVRRKARDLGSDGCTAVVDFYLDSCLEHDLHWRTGRTLHGHPISTAQANRRFRKVIQSRSRLGRFSPLAWVRWAGVSLGALILAHNTT